MSVSKISFFSISFSFVVVDQDLPYDLYVNSSSIESKEHFIRIWKREAYLSANDLEDLKKYHQLYIPEPQRGAYLKSLTKNNHIEIEDKAAIIKDSAIGYLDSLFDSQKEFNTDILTEAVVGCRDAVETMVEVIQDYGIQEVQTLIGNLSFHDFYTYDHSINVSMYSIAIFKAMKPQASKAAIITAGLGGLLHDLGKIEIPTHIINNPGKLSDEDFALIKEHPQFGLKLLLSQKEACIGLDLEAIGRIIFEHHENVDGTGYPRGLKGEEIHLMARITSIADFFDAITTKRSYHDVLDTQEAVNVMARTKGKKIDPEIFEIFLSTIKFRERSGQTKHELPSDFDPCQPHEELPFGEIKSEEERKDFGKIRIFDPSKDKEEEGSEDPSKKSKKKKSA